MPKLVHFEIETRDPQQTMKFYGEVFGWTFDQMMDDYWLIRTGEEGAMSGAIMATGRQSLRTVNTIGVPDIERFLATVPQAGGKVDSEIMDIPNVGRFAYCSDPQGVAFGVIQEY